MSYVDSLLNAADLLSFVSCAAERSDLSEVGQQGKFMVLMLAEELLSTGELETFSEKLATPLNVADRLSDIKYCLRYLAEVDLGNDGPLPLSAKQGEAMLYDLLSEAIAEVARSGLELPSPSISCTERTSTIIEVPTPKVVGL